MIGLWVGSLVLLLISPGPYMALACLFLVGLLPFALLFFWFAFAGPGVWIRSRLSTWHWSVLVAVFAVGHSLIGRKWAGDVVNEIFGVDARYFGNTTSLLTWFALPFGVVYKSEAIWSVFSAFLILALVVASLGVVWMLVADGIGVHQRFRIGWRSMAKFVAIIFFVSAYFGQLRFLPTEFKFLVKLVAIWADFNEVHPCGDSWVTPSIKVAFLDGAMVLVADENAEVAIRTCDFKRKLPR